MTTSPTENTEELRKKIQLIASAPPESIFFKLTDDEIEKIVQLVQAYTDQAVQAFGEKVLKDKFEVGIPSYHEPDASISVVPVSVITSLLKGEK